MSMQAGSGRSYRYYRGGAPLFPFGTGMSYTTFAITLNQEAGAPTPLAVGASKVYTVTVTNTGAVAGSASVLVYVNRTLAAPRAPSGGAQLPAMPTIVPEKDLVLFDACVLPVGGSATLTFTIRPTELGLYNDAGAKAVYAGAYTVEFRALGGSSARADLTVATTTVLETIPPVDNRPV